MESYPLLAGWGRVDVTPTESVPLHGYGNTERRMSQGNLDNLYVTCIAFTDEQENTVLLYTMDQLLTPRPVWEAAAKELSQRYGIPTSAVIIASTHTHSGPDMYQPLAESSARYRQVVADALLTAAEQAMADRKPAALEVGRTHTEGLNFVRSYFMGDHTVAGDNMGSFTDSTVWDHATKPDTEVQLIKVVREGGKDILMVNWQVHAKLASTNDSELGRARRPYASADLIGVCRDAVEEETDLLFAFFLGGAGNLNPLSRIPEENPVLDHLVYGRELAKVVVAGLDQLKPMATTGPVASKDSVLRGRCNHTEDHLAEKAREIAAMWQKDNNYRQCKAAGEPYGIHSPYHALLILRKLGMGRYENIDVAAARVGGLGFAVVPFEYFDTNSKDINVSSPFEMTFVLSCANGYINYIPSRIGFNYGCYEADSCRYIPGTAELMADRILELLDEMNEQA